LNPIGYLAKTNVRDQHDAARHRRMAGDLCPALVGTTPVKICYVRETDGQIPFTLTSEIHSFFPS